jgi:hypothetical protein
MLRKHSRGFGHRLLFGPDFDFFDLDLEPLLLDFFDFDLGISFSFPIQDA